MSLKSHIFLKHASQLRTLTTEKVLVLFLNKKKQIIAQQSLTQENEKQAAFSARSIFAPALLHGSDSIIVFHNHPSGLAFPSQADYVTTLALAEGAVLLHIELIDPIIVTHDDYFSFRDAGIL
jgi:DNA repair protein RadC